MPMVDGRYVPVKQAEVHNVQEWLGDVPADYNWAGDVSPGCYEGACEAQRALFAKCRPGTTCATSYGGWPRCCWGLVLRAGLAAKWPYWTPRPTVMIRTSMGSEWIDWLSLTDVREATERDER